MIKWSQACFKEVSHIYWLLCTVVLVRHIQDRTFLSSLEKKISAENLSRQKAGFGKGDYRGPGDFRSRMHAQEREVCPHPLWGPTWQSMYHTRESPLWAPQESPTAACPMCPRYRNKHGTKSGPKGSTTGCTAPCPWLSHPEGVPQPLLLCPHFTSPLVRWNEMPLDPFARCHTQQ